MLIHAAGHVELDLAGVELLKKGEFRKGLIAWFLSKNTSVGQKWIAKRLGMGDSSNVSRAVHQIERTTDSDVINWKRKLLDKS